MGLWPGTQVSASGSVTQLLMFSGSRFRVLPRLGLLVLPPHAGAYLVAS